MSYEKRNGAWTARVKLPENLSGSLSWRGQLLPLHPGTQTLKLDQ